MCTGKFIFCLKAHGSCNQVQNNHTNYEFIQDLHNFSLIRVMISHEVLKWKLEMQIAVKNTQYLFWVGEGKEANTPHIFPHHPEML